MSDFERRLVTLLELDLDRCGNEYGAAPCTAGTELDSGLSQAGGTANSIVLANTASAVTGFYIGDAVTQPNSGGQRRVIIAYDGPSRRATVDRPWAGAVPDALNYRVIESNGECYNTFLSCQDKQNFDNQVGMLKFCDRGVDLPVGESYRPSIVSKNWASTQIDLEKGLARRGSVRITLQDEATADVALDPYVSTRTPAALGTFWGRLLSRNKHYAGRFARIRRAYFDADWNPAQFVDELYIIESINGPDARGMVEVVLKDPVKLADRVKVPEASSGKTFADITALSTSVALEAGQGAAYGDSGFIRIGKEIIEFDSRVDDTLSWSDVAKRAQFGTTAVAHTAGAGVQICKVWQNVPVTTVLEELLTISGIDVANIDTVGNAVEESTWLGQSHNVTAAISSPTDASKLLEELLTLVRGFMWWSPTEQKMKFKVFAPASPTDTVPTLTDAGAWIEGSTKIKVREDLRTTVRTLFYDLSNATFDLREPVSFGRGEVEIDISAESANEYGARRDKIDFTRFWTDANAAAADAEVKRATGYYRDAPRDIEGRLSPRHSDVVEGQQIDVLISGLTDTEGLPVKTRCLVCCRTDRDGQIDVKVRTTTFGRRYAFIAPDTAPDYPGNSGSDLDSAFVSPDAGNFSDDGEPYLIF